MLKSHLARVEKDIQRMVEENLIEVLDMHFLASEYVTTEGGRIDTLAVDVTGAPVIIEYKRNKNDNVINQALSYLRWLKAQKVEFFEMLVMKKLKPEIGKDLKIDWKTPRVICIAESYSKFDIDTVEVIPMRIELFKYRYYEEEIFSLEPLNPREQPSPVSGKTIPPIESTDITLEALLPKASEKIKDLFLNLRSRILEIDENITEKATTLYVGYRVAKNFAEIHIGKSQIKIQLRALGYNDPRGMVEKIPEGYQWTLDRRVYLKEEEDLEYVLGLVVQSYQDVL